MNIRMLGTGGAINNGLPYNSFIINEDLLIETPPDIMISLFREARQHRPAESEFPRPGKVPWPDTHESSFAISEYI